MTDCPAIPESWLGLCPRSPLVHATTAVLIGQPGVAHASSPDGSGSPGTSQRIRRGISIATGSLKAMAHDRQLLWFTLLSGFVMFFLIAAEGFMVTRSGETALPFLIGIPLGDTFWVLDLRDFLLEFACLFCFTLILAGLVLHRNGKRVMTVTIRDGFAWLATYAGSLAVLSLALAVIATAVFLIISETQFIGRIVSGICMAVFHLPYAYYLPNELSSALFFAFELMFINSILLVIALYVVPGIVLEKKGLVPALAGAVTCLKRTWRELVGCIIVLSIIFLGITAIALLIGQSPLLLNRDYDFFISLSRGHMLMMVVCYGFILTCWTLLAVGATAAGVAISDLCTGIQNGEMPGSSEGNSSV